MMIDRINDVIDHWEISCAWKQEIMSVFERSDYRHKMSFFAGLTTLLSDNDIVKTLSAFQVKKENSSCLTGPIAQTNTFLISSFSSSKYEDIVEEAHVYLQNTLVYGFLDILYPEWGDTPLDLLQLVFSIFNPSGRVIDRIPQHNRWPLRGAYSKRIKSLCDAISKLSCNVLITGPSGVGKEAVARLIHSKSQNPGAFVATSIATIPKDLFSGVLFGYEKGAFTGAETMHLGCFELAQNGTLFLDEVADITPNQQAALLRVLSERQGTSIGGTRKYPITCRIIAATNKGIREENGFRSDLRIRLAEQEVACAYNSDEWKPLRTLSSVREEIPLLFAMQFVRCFHEQIGLNTRVKDFAIKDVDERLSERDVFDELSSHDWPMNFRELAYISLHSLLRFLVGYNSNTSCLSNTTLNILIKARSRFDTRKSLSEDQFIVDLLSNHIPDNENKWNYLSNYIHQKAIDYLRGKCGFTDAECARELGVARSSISRFLRKNEQSLK